jgi:hypothetical protein
VRAGQISWISPAATYYQLLREDSLLRTVTGNTTVASYCQDMQRKEIVVNKEYQRSDKVWPPAARSYLVETVLLDYPIPKLSLFQRTDVKSRKIIREIVDGQQRSKALLDFYEDKFALAKSIENDDWKELKYSELEEEDQQRFLSYQLSIDVFTSATDKQVREVFRRMNSYTIPLNDEEQRHAQWQGLYKWFIHSLTQQYDALFLRTGLFSEKSLVRMQDTKLLTEVCRAFLHGIETTKKTHLDAVYRDLDESFPQRADFEQRLTGALDQIGDWSELHGTSIMKPHIVYSLTLAIAHLRKPVPTLQTAYSATARPTFQRESILPRLSALAEGLDLDEEEQTALPANLRKFIAASSGRTNVKDQREKRFVWFCKVLSNKIP